ncbi:MAG TPA: glycosyltransferase family 39 protein [Myxococcales bacterium]|nr:glycosyltransferase family 39 protein [Myxococcales bacterium]
MSTQDPAPQPSDQTITESLLGAGFLDRPWVKRLRSRSETARLVLVVGLFAGVLYLPMLGAVGLWDCWEDHYGEVGRMMIFRRDYVFPYWENAPFFSKPPLTMWIQAVGMLLAGGTDGVGPGFGGLGWPSAILLLLVGGALALSPASARVHRQLGGWKWAASAAGGLVLAFTLVRGPWVWSEHWEKARANSGPDGALGVGTEWGVRLPMTALSIASLCLLALAVARVASRRAAYATAVILSTMPLYFLLSRQSSVTDVPFVSLMVGAFACAIIGQLDETTRRRDAWWYGFYACCAFGVFAKGLMGAGIPAAVLLLYAAFCLMPWDQESLSAHWSWLSDPAYRHRVRQGQLAMPWLWGQCYRMRLGTGLLLFFAMIGPWFAVLFSFPEVDDEGKRFWYRFLIHDHFARLTAGVHTTTPGGTFTYFVEWGGFALGPWVALFPGAFALAARLKVRGGDRVDHLMVLMVLWALGLFTLLDLSATKFHHYIFPVLPPVAVLMGLFADRLWKEGVAAHAVSVLAGLCLFALVSKDLSSNPKNFTDLFVYNYDQGARPYPMNEVAQKAMSLFGVRTLWTGDLLGILLIAFGTFLLVESLRAKEPAPSSRAMAMALALSGVGLEVAMLSGGKLSATLFLGLALALVAIYLGGEGFNAKGRDRNDLLLGAVAVGAASIALVVTGFRRGPAGDALQAFFTEAVTPKSFMGMIFLVGGGLAALGALQRAKGMMVGSFVGMVLVFAGWFNYSHYEDLSHHWTQRDQFWRYYGQRQPDEPIAAFLMNWRGETFYSRNRVKQIPAEQAAERMRRYANLPGRKWALVEHYRLDALRQAVGTSKRVTEVDRNLNNKFVLVTIE